MSLKKLNYFLNCIRSNLQDSCHFAKNNYFRCWLLESLKDYSLPTELTKGNSVSLSPILFGSSVAGTALEDGDADYSLVFYSSTNSLFPNNKCHIIEFNRDQQEKLLSSIYRHVDERSSEKMTAQRIFRARVPVVQFCSHSAIHKNFKFDVCLSVNGVRNSLLIRQYMESDPRLHIGCVLSKQWGRNYNILNSRRGWISPYALTILFIYYYVMESKKTFFTETDINNHLSHILSVCDEGRYNDIQSLNSSVPLATCDACDVIKDIRGFFRFYSTDFDFDSSVVDIRSSPIQKKDEWIDKIKDLPSFERWNLLGHENLFIRDPFEPHNLGRSVDFLKSEQIREAFRVSSHKDNPLFFLD